MYLKSLYPDVPPAPEMNVHHLLFHRPDQAEWKDYTLFIDVKTGKRRTFREFVERVQHGVTALGAPVVQGGLGFGTREDGEMIGIMSQNSMDYITLIHSLIGLTTPFAPIPWYSTPFELKHALELSKCTRLFVNASLLPLVLPVVRRLGMASSEVYVLGGKEKGRKSFSELVANARTKSIPAIAIRPAAKNTLAYLVFSSGTTGPPKAVMISHGNLIYSIMQIGVAGKVLEGVYTPPPSNTPEGIPVGLAFLPFHHSFGLHTFGFRMFLQPYTSALLDGWDIEVALKAIPQYKVSQLLLVPSVVHQLINHPNIRNADLSMIQTIACGAAHLPPNLAGKMTSITSAPLIQGFGMSECTISAIIQPAFGALGRTCILGSTGILLPGQEARILRDDGTEADYDEEGEMYLRGGNVAMGYWNNEKATRETFLEGGWLRTGDRFKVDKDGNFFFADRAKDTLKVSGIQVSPVEIENVLLANPKGLITDVTVAGVSSGRISDEKFPRAWIVLSESGRKMGIDKVKEELVTWHQENLSRYKWLRGGIEIVTHIPKSPTGKVLRRVLQDKYEQQAGRKMEGKL